VDAFYEVYQIINMLDEKLYVKIPTRIIDKFEKEVNCIDAKIFKCDRETQELNSLRDFLLPLLMNGKAGFKA